jgi:hypothetical protein
MSANNRVKVLQIQLLYNVYAPDLAEQFLLGLPAPGFSVTTVFLRGQPQESEPESKAGRTVYFDFTLLQLKGLRRLRY